VSDGALEMGYALVELGGRNELACFVGHAHISRTEYHDFIR
jgi:hypothetical protein